ncbi:SPFH domain, Band 7 family protein [Crenothrix polyspora]|uniref:SPFH domain, Band 7 family protein n=2 Tax=Crenothrix polyspora TaxID=360316 RepID=A0A1R4HAN1_9GAMM|nr:SPFH domain, Band 7 family protein [Crenothrix polyspora]
MTVPAAPIGMYARIKAWLKRWRASFIVALLITAMVLVFFFNRIVISIQSGEAGVLYRRFSGTETDTIYAEGLYIISPLDTMYIYEVRKQVARHEFDVISNKGLTIHLSLAVRYRPEYELLGVLHQRIGPNYLDRVILPQIESVMRKQLGHYSAEQIYTNEEGLLTNAILTALDEVGRNYVQVEDIIIRSIQLPPDMVSAIEDKLKQEEFMKSYEFRIKTATKEGERLKIEAEAVKTYHNAINESLTEAVLRYKGIEATQKLAASPNAKVVVIGSGKDGLPIILGGDQVTAAPAPPEASAANAEDKATKKPNPQAPKNTSAKADSAEGDSQ